MSRFSKPTKFQTKLLINGELVEGAEGRKIPVINPGTEELICEISEAGEKDVELAIESAVKALPGWSEISLRERSQYLQKLANLIERDLDEFIALESLDNGKPLEWAEFDIVEVVNHLRYYAGWADKITGKTFQTETSSILYTRREPYGVVGLISPWNYPMLMSEWKFGPALAAGNTVVHKISEVTPLTMLKLAELVIEVGFPKGVFNIVPGYGPVAGETLSRSRKIDKISFTGSTLVGRKILEASSQTNLKKVVLELGGKSPVIVCKDADLDIAAETAWNAIMFNMGQSCDAGSRLFVHQDVQDLFLEKLLEFNKSVKIGYAFDEGSNFGPLVNKVQFERVLGYIKHAKEVENLKCILGGNRYGQKGYFVEPTIFTEVDDNSRLAQEEIFGPVLVVLKPFKTLDEVIERANNTTYGLAAYIISQNAANVEKLVKHIKAGSFYVNQGAFTLCSMPFGGFKQSGFGRDNGEEGLSEYTQVKSVYYNTGKPSE